LDTLVTREGSFIDEAMQEHQTDLLYQVQLTSGREAYIYFLFEHKSYPDPLVGLQLLRYMVRFWEGQVKENGQLTPIIPLVIYHGEKVWSDSTSFLSLLDAPEALRSFLPDFHYHLSDFSYLSDETIRGEIWLRVNLSVLRAIFNPQLRQELEPLIKIIFELKEKRAGLEYIRTILYYLSRATERVSREELQTVLLRQGAEGERAMATIAQEFIQQGIEQGIEQSILRVLTRRFGNIPAAIAVKLTGLSVSDLEALLDEALTVPDLDLFVATISAVS
jgi:predicted transposase/invertase (TIGR01784 family)